MIGTPVTTVEESGASCRVGTGASLRFFRGAGTERGQLDGNGIIQSKTETVPCASLKR